MGTKNVTEYLGSLDVGPLLGTLDSHYPATINTRVHFPTREERKALRSMCVL